MILRELLGELHSEGIGLSVGSQGTFAFMDKIKTALLAISRGCSVNEVSDALNWKDFEFFVEEVFKRNDFQTLINVRLDKPRIQVDVLAHRGSLALSVDCKHWKNPHGASTLKRVADRQHQRTVALIESEYVRRLGIREGMPLIITLQQEARQVIGNVAIVSVVRLQNFITNMEDLRKKLALISLVKQDEIQRAVS